MAWSVDDRFLWVGLGKSYPDTLSLNCISIVLIPPSGVFFYLTARGISHCLRQTLELSEIDEPTKDAHASYESRAENCESPLQSNLLSLLD